MRPLSAIYAYGQVLVLTTHLSVRGGYQLLWIDGVALVPEQVAVSDPGHGQATVATSGPPFTERLRRPGVGTVTFGAPDRTIAPRSPRPRGTRAADLRPAGNELRRTSFPAAVPAGRSRRAWGPVPGPWPLAPGPYSSQPPYLQPVAVPIIIGAVEPRSIFLPGRGGVSQPARPFTARSCHHALSPGFLDYLLLGRGGLVFVLVVFVLPSIRIIGPTEVGLVTKRFSFRKLPDDNPIAFHGEAGYQADLLMPGWRFKFWVRLRRGQVSLGAGPRRRDRRGRGAGGQGPAGRRQVGRIDEPA